MKRICDYFQIEAAVEIIRRGGVIAYPTEAVYGLGCDPLSKNAVKKILELKGRDTHKRFILISHSFEILRSWIQPLSRSRMDVIISTWPGPITWVFPVADWVPAWVHGGRGSIALRVSAHPVVIQLCELYQHALISTSANPQDKPPAKTVEEVKHYFNQSIDYLIEGPLGDLSNPTEIRDAVSNVLIRKS